MRVLLTFSLLFFLSISLKGQGFHKKADVSSAVLKKYERAGDLARVKKYTEALESYASCQKKDPLFYDAFYQSGLIYGTLGQFEEAELAFMKCLALSTSYRRDLQLLIGQVNSEQKKYAEAIEYYEAYLASSPRNEKQIKLVQKFIEDTKFLLSVEQDIPFDPRAMEAFNTKRDEYFPSISIEGDEFVFTRRIIVGDNFNEDFYRSVKDPKATEWPEAIPFKAMNTTLDEGARSISADGKTVIVTYCNQSGALGSCDLYISTFKAGEWSKYRNLGKPINSSKWESQPAISANGDQLIFCSNRLGGYGGKDLWISKLNRDNTWSEPVNLGPAVNTSMDDKTPFLHSDGRTLYFMSNGHPGFGGFDLFISRLDDEGNWSKPTNLGSPLNTESDEGLMIVNFQGDKAYFATDRRFSETTNSSRSNYDLYEFDLYEAARPQKAVFVRGIVRDAETLEPIKASLELVDIRRNDSGIFKETDTDGEFLFVLEDLREFGLFAQAANYGMHSMNFNLLEDNLESERGLEIFLQPLRSESEEHQTILENVFFQTGSAALQEKSYRELDRLAELILSNKLGIRIIGHTDDVGNEESNQKLSEDRAEAVVKYLLTKGVSESSLFFEGRGEEEPLADNETASGRKKNRRTSFVVVD